MTNPEKLDVIDREPADDQANAEQTSEKIVSFLLNRYIKERDKDKE